MEFCDFATKLKDIISKGSRDPDFVRELFLNVVKNQEDIDYINEHISDTTARYYLRGEHSIERVARRIQKHYEPELFAAYINGVGEQAQQDICHAFEPFIPDINMFNVAEKCRDAFVEIITEAAKTKRRKKKQKQTQNAVAADPDKYSQLHYSLLTECMNKCPKCGQYLVSFEKDGSKNGNYVIIDLAPWLSEPPKDEVEANIMLCDDCAEHFNLATPKKDYEELIKLKQRIILNYRQMCSIETLHLEDGVDRILRSLSGLAKKPETKKTKYSALELKKKITEENFMLMDEIQRYVETYFEYIREQIGELENQGVLKFRQLRHDFNDCYGMLAEGCRTQQEIFDDLTTWVMDRTNVNHRLAAQAVVAFFVRICEVFDEITE